MPVIEWNDNYIITCNVGHVKIELDWDKRKVTGITILDAPVSEPVNINPDLGNCKILEITADAVEKIRENPSLVSLSSKPAESIAMLDAPVVKTWNTNPDSGNCKTSEIIADTTPSFFLDVSREVKKTVFPLDKVRATLPDIALDMVEEKLLEYIGLYQPCHLPVTSLTENSTLYGEREKLLTFIGTESKNLIHTAIESLILKVKIVRSRKGKRYPYVYRLADKTKLEACPRCNQKLETLTASDVMPVGERISFKHCSNCGQDFYE